MGEIAILAVWGGCLSGDVEARRQKAILDFCVFSEVCYTRICRSASGECLRSLILCREGRDASGVDADDAEFGGGNVSKGRADALLDVERGCGGFEVLAGRRARSCEDAGHVCTHVGEGGMVVKGRERDDGNDDETHFEARDTHSLKARLYNNIA